MAIPLLGIGALLGRTAAAGAARGVAAGAARAAARGGISAGARMGLGRGAQAGIARGIKGGVRGLPRAAGRIGRDIIAGGIGGGDGFLGGLTHAIQGMAGSIFGGGQDQTIQPVTVNVVEGFASALKGTPPAGDGGGGGAIVPFGGSPLVSRESTAITKSDDPIIDRLDELKRIFQKMLELEKESLESLRNQVLNFARSSEKEGRTKEQDQQEKTKKESNKSEKNPIIKKGKKAFGGIFDFIKSIISSFVQYKILDWLSKPENKKLIQGTVQFFMNVVKMFQLLHERFLGPFRKLLTSIMGGGFQMFMDLMKLAVDFISLKWLTNPKEFIDSLLNIPKTLLEVIPNILLSLVDFLTFGFFNGAIETIQNGLKNLFGVKDQSKPEGTEEIQGDSTTGNAVKEGVQKFNPIAQAGEAIKGVAGAVLNPIGTIGNLIGGLFGGKKEDSEKPQLREGGVVGPTQGSSGVSVEPLDKISETSGILSTIKKTSKMFMDLLTMPFKLVGAALLALTVNTIGKIPGVGPFIKPLLDNIISTFDLPSSIASMVTGKSNQEKQKDEKKPSATKTPEKKPEKKPEEDNKDKGDATGAASNLYTMLTGKESAIQSSTGSETSEPGQSASPGSPPAAGSLSFDQLKSHAVSAGFNDADATRMAAIAMAESSGNPKAHNSTPPDNSYGLWQINMIGNLGPARRKQLGISSNEQLFDPATNAKAAKMIKDSQGWNAWTVHKTGKYKQFMPSKKEGGWITGPQSGYPVSLDGGMSTSFIGHGTEWVGFKKASGGSVSSAFVIPFDTPSTRSNGGLVGKRMREAKSGGYALPYSAGGVVKTDGIWDTGPGYTIKGASDQQGRPIVFSQAAANAFAQMMSASGGKVRGSDVASSKRSPAKNRAVGGAAGSKHMYGTAMDIHGSSNAWIRQNGAKFGWVANDYPGSHGGHFEFKGAGITPQDSKTGPGQDGTKPDTAGPSAPGTTSSSGGGDVLKDLKDLYTILTGQGASGDAGGGLLGSIGSVAGGIFGGPVGSVIGGTVGGIFDGKSPLNSIASNFGNLATGGMDLGPVGSVLTNVPNYSSKFKTLQTENLVNTAFGSTVGGATQVINAPGSVTSSMNQSLDTANLGSTLPKNGNWSIYKTNL